MFGFRAYPTPIVRPMWPFMTAAGIVFFGVNYLQDKMVSTPEARKDPKNPYGERELPVDSGEDGADETNTM